MNKMNKMNKMNEMNKMKKALPFILLALVLAGAVGLQKFQGTGSTGYEAADFALPGLDGTRRKLSDFRGNVVFLNLWATWCPPCVAEMPSIEALYRRFHSQGLVILAVSADSTGAAAVAPLVKQLGVTFPVLLDPEGTLSPRYGVTGYPETFVIGRDGRVVEHVIGPTDWSSTARFNYFDTLLRQPTGIAG